MSTRETQRLPLIDLLKVIGSQLIVLHHLATAAGGALEGRVVNHHQLAITRQVQVEFAAGHAVFQATLEAGEGVFRRFALGAAVAVDQGHG
jgi:hypothetical protein